MSPNYSDVANLDTPAIRALRHTASHVLAQAVKRLFPNARLAIGPSISKGFYYDFDFGADAPTTDDLPAIEASMTEIIKNKLSW